MVRRMVVETLTVLFTDLAGSTSLRVARGEELADALLVTTRARAQDVKQVVDDLRA